MRLQPKYHSILLPESGVTCRVFVSYGDRLAIDEVLTRDMKFSLSKKKEEGQSEEEIAKKIEEQLSEQEQFITMGQLNEQSRVVISRCVKNWDATDEEDKRIEPTADNILNLLSDNDGQFLYKEINSLLKKTTENELTKEEKKE
jgi:hypothetical protein